VNISSKPNMAVSVAMFSFAAITTIAQAHIATHRLRKAYQNANNKGATTNGSAWKSATLAACSAGNNR
jgi:hypothetical protein